MKKLFSCLLLRKFQWLLILVVGAPVSAHDARPAYLHLSQRAVESADKDRADNGSPPGGAVSQWVYDVQWKLPVSLPPDAHPIPGLPEFCHFKREAYRKNIGDAYVYKNVAHCDTSLADSTITLRYPRGNPGLSALLRVEFASGEQYSNILKPDAEQWRIPASENRLAVASQYVLLGVEHIFAGIDHLLFVACLVFIAGSARKILLTVTGFTLAHSLTLILSSLDLVRLPIAPVEATIALSIVFLAHEIVVNNRDSWTWRYPLVVSSLFGLLHGFGFASVLREIGLPQNELVVGLVAFNIGVELGQVLFIFALLAVFALVGRAVVADRISLQNDPRIATSCGYMVGTVASYWFVERSVGIFG